MTAVKLLLLTSNKLARGVGCLGASRLHNFSTYNDGAQREFLASLQGGSVDLQKDDDSGIATIQLNQPDKKNGLSGSMMVDLRDIVEELESWSQGKGVVLHGAGGTFCSGGDLALVKRIFDPQKGSAMSMFMQNTMTRFLNLPLVSVALIEGAALGGGAELSVSCDFRLATPSAKLGFVHGRMGASPGWGGGAKLTTLVGRTTALDLLTTARVLGSEEMLRLGLIQDVVGSDGDPLAGARAWLAARVALPREVVGALKAVVVSASEGHRHGVLDRERDAFATVWGGPAHRAAVLGNIKHK